MYHTILYIFSFEISEKCTFRNIEIMWNWEIEERSLEQGGSEFGLRSFEYGYKLQETESGSNQIKILFFY